MEEFLRWVPFIFVVTIAAAIFFTYRRRPSQPAPAGKGPSGIAGWLLFPAVLVVLLPFVAFANAVSYGSLLRTTPSIPLTAAEILANAVFAVASGYLALRFFQLRKFVPRFFAVVTFAGVAYTLIDYVVGSSVYGTPLAASDPNASGAFVGVPTMSILWAVYMLVSVRVRNTFVR